MPLPPAVVFCPHKYKNYNRNPYLRFLTFRYRFVFGRQNRPYIRELTMFTKTLGVFFWFQHCYFSTLSASLKEPANSIFFLRFNKLQQKQ